MELRNIFKPQKFFICPFCLQEVYYSKIENVAREPCGNCKSLIPRQYVNAFHLAYPLFLQIIGWSSVGKTTYLQALTLRLWEIGTAWKGFSCQPLTEIAEKYISDVLLFEQTRTMPERTKLSKDDAYILHLRNMSRWHDRTLVIRDVAGELFDKFIYEDKKVVPYTLNVPASIVMLDLTDFNREPPRVPERLLNSIIQTVEDKKYGSSQTVQGRTLIAVFSKADKIIDEFPNVIQEYLENDPFLKKGALELKTDDYMDKMVDVSNILSEWYCSHPKYRGHNFVNLAENTGMKVCFCATSSTGRDLDDQISSEKLPYALEPRRVIDPFLWALEFQSKE